MKHLHTMQTEREQMTRTTATPATEAKQMGGLGFDWITPEMEAEIEKDTDDRLRALVEVIHRIYQQQRAASAAQQN
jgi:hypothetical protein